MIESTATLTSCLKPKEIQRVYNSFGIKQLVRVSQSSCAISAMLGVESGQACRQKRGQKSHGSQAINKQRIDLENSDLAKK